jgi:hypothetical protein
MKQKLLIFSLIAAAMMTSCSTEYKLAKSFVKQSKDSNVAIYFPEKADVQNARDEQSGREMIVLCDLDQDLFLNLVYAAYKKTLKDYGLKIYQPDDPENVQVDSAHWLAILSKMEIQEKITEYEDYWFDADNTYSYIYPLNTVNVASWFDLNNQQWSPALYVEKDIVDGFDSKVDFAFWTGQSSYSYAIDTLQARDIYNFAIYLGKLYAGYTYDYFLNDYISDNLKAKDMTQRFYYRYDPYLKKILFTEDGDLFIRLTEEK